MQWEARLGCLLPGIAAVIVIVVKTCLGAYAMEPRDQLYCVRRIKMVWGTWCAGLLCTRDAIGRLLVCKVFLHVRLPMHTYTLPMPSLLALVSEDCIQLPLHHRCPSPKHASIDMYVDDHHISGQPSLIQ